MNRLADQTSPYLRQHAENPVDWYPWGQDAFAAARLRDVPILLSIGYSACHWCHVMAHESFEDPATAGVMNAGFVNIKVDREERPDVDAIYMEAVQAVTGSGGWPMTVFLLPDGRPFLGGTYFPRDRLAELLGQVSRAWHRRRPDLEAAATQLAEAVRAGTALPGRGWNTDGGGAPDLDGGGAPSGALLGAASDTLLARFDAEWGGFGGAPKFPQPAMLELLLLAAFRTGRADVAGAVTTTLDAMAAGGIYDHLAGGFARYSTDRRWLVPHFEKMLYDNAQLTRVYLHAFQLTGAVQYRQVVTETLEYLLRSPMRLPGGGLASAEDADSEGEEGRFYVWGEAEVLEVAGPPARDWYGVTDEGNWEGRNILCRPLGASLSAPARGRGGPGGPLRPSGAAGPARPGRQGADRVERYGRGRPRRGGRLPGQRTLDRCRRRARRFSAGQPAPPGGRAMVAQLAVRWCGERARRRRCGERARRRREHARRRQEWAGPGPPPGLRR